MLESESFLPPSAVGGAEHELGFFGAALNKPLKLVRYETNIKETRFRSCLTKCSSWIVRKFNINEVPCVKGGGFRDTSANTGVLLNNHHDSYSMCMINCYLKTFGNYWIWCNTCECNVSPNTLKLINILC